MRALAVVLAFAGLLAACGGGRGSAQESGATGPVGTWERAYVDAVGQPYLDVLELHADGTYAVHASAVGDDRGAYQVSGDAMDFQSAVDPSVRTHLVYDVRADGVMAFDITAPAPGHVEWRRSQRTANFDTVAFRGREAPSGVPALLETALAVKARPWRADALPTAIAVEELPHGHYRIRFSFYAPSTNEEMQVDVTRYLLVSRVHDGSRAPQRPLPPTFVDLTDVLSAADAGGVPGALREADLRAYQGGPAWMISTAAPAAATFSADTARRITDDVTGYIGQYEADWDHAAEIWREVMARNAPKPDSAGTDAWSRSLIVTDYECRARGGVWYDDPNSSGHCS